MRMMCTFTHALTENCSIWLTYVTKLKFAKCWYVNSCSQMMLHSFHTVFVPGCEPSVTATTFLNELVVNFSLSDVKNQQEIDVYYHFTNFIQSLDSAGLGKTLKWAVGATTIPPLGLPKKISVQFLHGCTPGCKCRPSTSTCDLRITITTHLDNEDNMNTIMALALGDSEGFGLI